jgi:hypothetical protein
LLVCRSDWDFSIYYRGRFDPQALRDIGVPLLGRAAGNLYLVRAMSEILAFAPGINNINANY